MNFKYFWSPRAVFSLWSLSQPTYPNLRMLEIIYILCTVSCTLWYINTIIWSKAKSEVVHPWEQSIHLWEKTMGTGFSKILENRIKAISLLIKKAAVSIIPDNKKERETRDKFKKKQENFMEISKLYWMTLKNAQIDRKLISQIAPFFA